MSLDLTVPTDRTQGILRWGVCFVAVLLVHALAIARLLEESDVADAPSGPQVVMLDLARGDPTPAQEHADDALQKPVQQDVKPPEEPEQKEAEVTLPKEVQEPEPRTSAQPTTAQEEKEAKAPPQVLPEAVRRWQMTVNDRLNQFKRYPAEARRRGQQGTATVVFTLDSAGRVLSSGISKSSGFAALDRETLDLLLRAQPFPVPPNGAGKQDLFLQVPINYGLQ